MEYIVEEKLVDNMYLITIWGVTDEPYEFKVYDIPKEFK